MANLRDLRKRRKSAASTKKITRTMELVASAKLKKAQDAAVASRPYAEALRRLVARLVVSGGSHPLLTRRSGTGKVLIMVAASDRGLCGSFNANLANLAVNAAKAHHAAGHQVDIIALGKKGGSTLGFLGFPVIETHSKLVGSTTYAAAEAMANQCIERFRSGAYDRVEVVYARFLSAARQLPEAFVLLPAGLEADSVASTSPAGDCEYVPDVETVLAGVVAMAVRTALYSALLQTSAAEHAARRVAMKNAADAAGDMVRDLNLKYNRGRQGKITQEIAEIVGAVEAMA